VIESSPESSASRGDLFGWWGRGPYNFELLAAADVAVG
jgi:hypothetical protein